MQRLFELQDPGCFHMLPLSCKSWLILFNYLPFTFNYRPWCSPKISLRGRLMSCIQITVSDYFLRHQMLRVAKAIPEINANKSVHFVSIARNRFNLLLLNLVFFFFFLIFFSCSPLFIKCWTNIPYLSWPNTCVYKTRAGNKDIAFDQFQGLGFRWGRKNLEPSFLFSFNSHWKNNFFPTAQDRD